MSSEAPAAAIPFNRPLLTGDEAGHVLAAMQSGRLSGDGPYTRRCERWFETAFGSARALMVPSCTHALELAALLLDIGPGDEVILPSYTFVSTANPFVLRGAVAVFVDVEPGTMNLDLDCVEAAITPHTRAIVPVHYGGMACDMAALTALAARHGIAVVEDNAQGMLAERDGRLLGTWGGLAAISFHESKNFTSGGEGGLLLVNDPALVRRAEILREKGTDRSAFIRGEIDRYTWQNLGSSFLPSELQCAYLWGQLGEAGRVTEQRRALWQHYRDRLAPLAAAGHLQLPGAPAGCRHNGHLFFLKCADTGTRDALIDHLRSRGIAAPFHYLPLHSAPAGLRFGRFHGEDRHTSSGARRLLRLPLWFGLPHSDQDRVVAAVAEFFDEPA